MALSPLFFSLNLIFGRLTGAEVAPFTLAFLRWASVAIILAPFALGHGRAVAATIAANLPVLVLLGFLGMWMCGGPVYLALQMTSATNGALIFAVTPVIIILIEAVFRGRSIGWREGLGSALALAGAFVIVLRGDLAALIHMTLNAGDLILVGAMLAWATYSVVCRSPRLALPNIALLFAAAGAGAALLAPFAFYEWLSGAAMPVTGTAWAGIAGIILFPSLLAYSAHQFGMRVLGPSVASIFMYLLPPYGVGLALVILGEPFGAYQAVGIALVMAGVILATLPVQYVQRAVGSVFPRQYVRPPWRPSHPSFYNQRLGEDREAARLLDEAFAHCGLHEGAPGLGEGCERQRAWRGACQERLPQRVEIEEKAGDLDAGRRHVPEIRPRSSFARARPRRRSAAASRSPKLAPASGSTAAIASTRAAMTGIREKSHTQAATSPPGRVTRRISRSAARRSENS